MLRRTAVFIAALLLLSLTACGLLGGGAADDCTGGGSLLQDDFGEGQDCGWALYNRSGAVIAIENGTMQVTTSSPGQIYWTNPGRQFDNVIMTVQARQVSGPNDNAYGLICRYQDESNFYLFLISGDGYYMIGKFQAELGKIEYLSGNGEFTFSDVINQGVATNQIRASCIGNELTLSVNGVPLATVTDTSFASGDVGVGASTFEPGAAVIQFDDLRVLAP